MRALINRGKDKNTNPERGDENINPERERYNTNPQTGR